MKIVSSCCRAEMRVDGGTDFIGSDEIRTQWNVCKKCGEPCDRIDLDAPIQIIIKGSLCSLNDYILKERANKYIGAKIKKDNTNFVLKQLPNIKIDHKIDIEFNWYCKNKRKDPDNICFARKFILDAMVLKGIIKNDGWKNIGSFKDNFYVNKEEMIELRITKSDEEQMGW